MRYYCGSGTDCCTIEVQRYTYPKDFHKWRYQKHTRKHKAGAFIYDPETNRVLIVQSRAELWGPPKGSAIDDESIKECAIREVEEETGLNISNYDLSSYHTIKGWAHYYFITMKQCDVKVQTEVIDNDANGISWIKVDCLKDMVSRGMILLNQHFRILSKIFLQVEFPIIRDEYHTPHRRLLKRKSRTNIQSELESNRKEKFDSSELTNERVNAVLFTEQSGCSNGP